MRHHAHILTTIWDDPDFVALPASAQRLYFQLMTQKKLTMVGLIAYTPRNWARGCSELTVNAIESAVTALEAADFVLVDTETEELVIRTSVRHDPPRGFKSIKGMWNAWQMVDSKPLQRAILDVLPAEIWDCIDAPPPDEAKALRNAPCHTPSDGVSDGGSDARNREVDSTHHHPPTTPTPHPSPDDGFDGWWESYPRKVGKKNARTAWRNLTKTERQLATEALPAHLRAWSGESVKHIPHPTTWLHGKRWEDELTTKRATKRIESSGAVIAEGAL